MIQHRNSQCTQENLPLFERKQSKIKKQDFASNTIMKLIDKYHKPMHVIVRRSIKGNEDDDDDDDDEETDWIKIVDDEDLSLPTSSSEQQQQQLEETSSFNRRQRYPLVLLHKKKYIQRIQHELEDKDYVLLKAYNSHTYYLCQTNEMEQKVSEHMIRTNAYTLIEHNKYEEKYKKFVHFPLNALIRRVTTALDELNRKKSISHIQFQQLHFDKSKVKIDHLSFQPDVHEVKYLSIIVLFHFC